MHYYSKQRRRLLYDYLGVFFLLKGKQGNIHVQLCFKKLKRRFNRKLNETNTYKIIRLLQFS